MSSNYIGLRYTNPKRLIDNPILSSLEADIVKEDVTTNVKYWGAKGDGVTDDTVAIQAAIDSNTSGQLYFPAGTYLLSSTIFLTSAEKMKISGDGAGSIIKRTDGSSNMFTLGSTTNVIITSLTFEFVAGSTVYHILNFQNARRCVVTNCQFYITSLPADGQYGCIQFRNTLYSKVYGCHFEVNDPTYDITQVDTVLNNSRNGIYVTDGSSEILIQDNTSFQIGVPYNIQGVASPVTNVSVVGNSAYKSANYGIMLYSRDTVLAPVSRGTVTGNVVDTVYGNYFNSATTNYTHGTGIYLQGVFQCTVSGNTVTNVAINTNSQTLVPACIGCTSASKNCVINANFCSFSPFYAIDASGTNITVSNNVLKNCPTGVIVRGESIGTNITGNTVVVDDATLLAGTTFGIRTTGIPAKQNMMITNNNLQSVSTGISLSSEVTDAIIKGNIYNEDAGLNTGFGIDVDTTECIITENRITKTGGWGMRLSGKSMVDNNFVSGAVTNQHLVISAPGSYVGYNDIASGNISNETGVVAVAIAATVEIPYYSPGMLIELTGTGTLNQLDFNLSNALGVFFNIMAQGAGCTIAHLGAGSGIRFYNVGAAPLVMTADTIYSYRYSPHLLAFVQIG